ncbi:lipopolysaccharide transport system ATP-binding protein [Candidatus Nanopelagicus abundans]|uniref:Lipopolysaccharide transport system ATP-binding protein n=1 Tax=Candidatus Nanopelagicus abundans TaxID=1884916 RepID=A0A249L5V6_9ACTN|nr:ATP-binding cassette domain-containing protein [Candidatus Nanopelagicus abundans]ASY24315.1 lipopolysaccharide transport system ATP-binding protein [Candidatus Nanopelagicus abundans]
MNVIEAKNISFAYRVLNKQHSSLKTLFRDFLHGKVSIEDYVAIKNITFEIKKGETVAIIGKNGAGKSTLLKILARVINPTTGSILITGQVAPMIELGAGFNSELTGKENILFYSALLDRDIDKVKPRINEIINWAGVADHLDYQLRTYSTGMVARLAFSVATDEIPDILLIDEVLSVGDGEFAIKSRKRLLEIITSGCTVIMVSHDLATVAELAQKVIWIEKGQIEMVGQPAEVIAAYQVSGA